MPLWLPLCIPCRHHAVPATIMRSLPPSCGPCCNHAVPAVIVQPLPPLYGHCRHRAVLAAIMGTLPPSSDVCMTLSHCNPFNWSVLQLGCSYLFPATPARHAAPARVMQPLLLSCSPCCFHAAPAAIMRPLPLSCGTCHCHGFDGCKLPFNVLVPGTMSYKE
jgi:hypothetical protein